MVNMQHFFSFFCFFVFCFLATGAPKICIMKWRYGFSFFLYFTVVIISFCYRRQQVQLAIYKYLYLCERYMRYNSMWHKMIRYILLLFDSVTLLWHAKSRIRPYGYFAIEKLGIFSFFLFFFVFFFLVCFALFFC